MIQKDERPTIEVVIEKLLKKLPKIYNLIKEVSKSKDKDKENYSMSFEKLFKDEYELKYAQSNNKEDKELFKKDQKTRLILYNEALKVGCLSFFGLNSKINYDQEKNQSRII